MSTFDDASLVFIPSGYKTSKAYSVKPSDGSGDLTFSRSNDTATRVNSAGLIEKVRTNQVLQSETLDNAYWSKINISITANAIANPLNGALTADLLTVTDPSGPVEKTMVSAQTQSFTAGTPYTISAYYKAGSVSTVFRILAYDGTALYTGGTIDLATIGNSTAPYVSVGNGWYRFSFTFTPANSTSVGFIYLVNYAFGVAANAGTNVYVYGAQIERGDIATDYIATTSAAVSVGPVANVPRLDYLNSSCPRLLLEPQRTNFAIYSENISQSSTTLSGGTVATNVVASPDGMQDADSFTVNTANSAHSGYYEAYNATNGQPFTVSVFAKAGTGRYFLLRSMTNTYATRFGATIDLQTGTILSTNNAGVPAPTGTASKIESYGNGWYRISLTMNAIGSQMAYIWETSNSATPTLDAFLDYSYTGNGTDSYYIWGLQMENGAYATSYIPTLGAAVTRGADACSKTSISSLIGQTEGTLFIETTYNGAANTGQFNRLINITDGTTTNFISLAKNNTTAELYVYSETSAGVQVNSTPIANTNIIGTHKIALAYKANDFVLYVDGVQRFTDTSAAVAVCNTLNIGTLIGGDELGGSVNQAILFKTRLTNAQLAELTTL